MANYWIRNRGRVQGPYTADQIQGLQRRGRFSRLFHVSEDNKSWHPAEDFPELFEGRRRGRSNKSNDDEFDETPFSSGGSAFDDDDDAPPTRGAASKRKVKAKKRPVDEEDNDDDDDADWEDDENWEDDDAGLLTGVVDWVEANVKLLAGLLVVVLLGLGWFVFFREDWTQDTADFEQLLSVNTRVGTASQMGSTADAWVTMQEQTQADLAPMVARLNKVASSQDHVKQELLFIARDDIPQMFKELPNGIDSASKRVLKRLGLIDEMINNKQRHSDESVLPMMSNMQAQQPNSNNNQPPPAAAPNAGYGNSAPGFGPGGPNSSQPGNSNSGGDQPVGAPPGNNTNQLQNFQPGGSQPKDNTD